jgi:uncharacterized protein (DUF2062 family)
MPKKFLRRVLPNRVSIQKISICRRFDDRLNIPELWHVQRDSVALGLAIGVFCGMIPGPLQVISALALTIIFRVNLPIAIIGTCLTNPITIVPIYMLAYGLGQSLLGMPNWRQLPDLPVTDWTTPSIALQNWMAWVGDLGTPWVIGMIVLASAMAALAYCATQVIWRTIEYLKLQAHKRRRKERANKIREEIRNSLRR